MTTRCTDCGKPTPHYGFYTTCTACDVKDQIEQSRIKVGAAGAVREYLDLIERRLLDAPMLPPMALDRPSSGAAAAAEAEVQRYKVQWNIPGTALAAEERGLRRDDRADALQYALTGRKCGKYAEAMQGGCDKPAGHAGFCSGPTKGFHGHDHGRGMPVYDFPCECGRTWRGTDRDRGRRCPVCLGQESKLREAAMAPVPASTLPEWLTDEALSKPPPRCERCNACLFYAEQEHRDSLGNPCVKPPTLREWLGDRVSELGPWADVLREHPVPAGWIAEWRWLGYGALGHWRAHGAVASAKPQEYIVDRSMVIRYTREPHATTEAYLMAIFTRHPDVKPEPRPVRTWFGNEGEV